MIRNKLWRIGFIIVLMLSSSFVHKRLNNDLRIEKIEYALENFTESYPQQKVYLHLDKSSYKYGDIIWIKAYLVNALTHKPDTRSTNLYLELVDPSKTVAERKRLRIVDGFAKGDIIIRDTMPEGLYQVRAYTNWMRNLGPGFYFTKNIPVSNPVYKTHLSPGDSRKNRRILKRHSIKMKDFDFQFLPEGGDLVYGLSSKVGFKAVNREGKGVNIKGTLYKSGKEAVLDFSAHAKGMGHFVFKPVRGEKYYAMVESNGKSVKVNMPVPHQKGIVLSINNSSSDVIKVKLTSNRYKTDDRMANEMILIGQTRGRIHFSQIVDLSEDSAEVSINKYLFPTGITQITVFSSRLIPQAERLVFINHDDFISFTLESTEKITKDSLRLKIASVDSDKRPVLADFSMVMLDAEYINEDRFNYNIVHYLTLSSDLKGYVEDPQFYFAESDPFTVQALDNLMMTQGWRRFNWEEVLSDRKPEMEYEVEKYITVEGKITREFFEIPLADCEVRLTVFEQYNDVFYTKSAKDGRYKFDNLIYYDTVDVKIEANRPSGRKNLVIVLPESEPDEVSHYYGDVFLTTESTRNNKAYRKKMNIKTREKIKEEQKEKSERNIIEGIYGEPDDVIRGEDIPEGYTNVLQAIQGRVPGVDVQGNKVIIRGIKTIYGSTDPLYVIDGVPVDNVESVLNIPIQDVDRIEILKGASTAIYGSRGANGVIAVYTKRGEFLIKGRIEFQMLGYATPRQFYVPKFDGFENTDEYRPVTLGWISDIRTDENGHVTVKQTLPENLNKIIIMIEGISMQGVPGASKFIVDL